MTLYWAVCECGVKITDYTNVLATQRFSFSSSDAFKLLLKKYTYLLHNIVIDTPLFTESRITYNWPMWMQSSVKEMWCTINANEFVSLCQNQLVKWPQFSLDKMYNFYTFHYSLTNFNEIAHYHTCAILDIIVERVAYSIEQAEFSFHDFICFVEKIVHIFTSIGFFLSCAPLFIFLSDQMFYKLRAEMYEKYTRCQIFFDMLEHVRLSPGNERDRYLCGDSNWWWERPILLDIHGKIGMSDVLTYLRRVSIDKKRERVVLYEMRVYDFGLCLRAIDALHKTILDDENYNESWIYENGFNRRRPPRDIPTLPDSD